MLTVEAADLWLAVLMAMNAVTATGYSPVPGGGAGHDATEADRGG